MERKRSKKWWKTGEKYSVMTGSSNGGKGSPEANSWHFENSPNGSGFVSKKLTTKIDWGCSSFRWLDGLRIHHTLHFQCWWRGSGQWSSKKLNSNKPVWTPSPHLGSLLSPVGMTDTCSQTKKQQTPNGDTTSAPVINPGRLVIETVDQLKQHVWNGLGAPFTTCWVERTSVYWIGFKIR